METNAAWHKFQPRADSAAEYMPSAGSGGMSYAKGRVLEKKAKVLKK
jgi:hypothetical protein